MSDKTKIQAFIAQIAKVAIENLQDAADYLDVDFEAIDAIALPVEFVKHQGIYFFISGGKIIYVGQSVNAIGRIMSHMKAQWYKDALSKGIRICYLPIPDSMYLDFVESWYIRKFKPIGNRNGGPVGGRYLKDFLIRYLGKNLRRDERLTNLVNSFIEDDIKKYT